MKVPPARRRSEPARQRVLQVRLVAAGMTRTKDRLAHFRLKLARLGLRPGQGPRVLHSYRRHQLLKPTLCASYEPLLDNKDSAAVLTGPRQHGADLRGCPTSTARRPHPASVERCRNGAQARDTAAPYL